MKRIFLLIFFLAVSTAVYAGEDAPAVLETTDGKALRVFLMGIDGDQVSTEYQKLRQKKTFAAAEIKVINFNPKGFNELELTKLSKSVAELYDAADYDAVVAEIEPVVAPFAPYMSVSNNLQNMYGLLMEAYCRSDMFSEAAKASENLSWTADKSLQIKALVCGAVAASGQGDVAGAKNILKKIEDPAAALYAQAVIAQAEGNPREAIQIAVDLIAEYTNDRTWMPPTELLCAELYLELGRTNSAQVTARQTAKLYQGTNIEKEAEAFRTTVEQLTNESE
jgi:tetratricopeptide (TPR) repeat protein